MAEAGHRYYQRLPADMARWPIKLLSNVKRRCHGEGIPCT
jgi:hypothetical protein